MIKVLFGDEEVVESFLYHNEIEGTGTLLARSSNKSHTKIWFFFASHAKIELYLFCIRTFVVGGKVGHTNA